MRAYTALNIMAGFRKCGVFPFNPSEITDHQIMPLKAVGHQQTATANPVQDDSPQSPLFFF